MHELNNHVKEYINYYASLNIPPEFALLIKGSWGCGKTFLVNQCIEDLKNRDKNKIKFLSISLYGISNISDIETKFFQMLNPALSSKGMVLAGRFAKGILKGALKIDLDGDGKDEGSLSVGIPDIDLKKYLTNIEDTVLVFDDFERCSMPIMEVMGYINYFVEKEGYKVIIICDEDKLISNEADSSQHNSYNTIKEKLVGKTIEVKADIALVVDTFISDLIKDSNLVNFLQQNENVILDIFSAAGYNNLRSLRKLLIDFQRFWNALDKPILEKQGLSTHLLILHAVLSLETSSGNIKGNEFDKILEGADIARKIGDQDKEKTKYDVISEKYSRYQNQMYVPLISITVWSEIFDNGNIDKDLINSLLKKTSYFYDENTPEWQKLWHFRNLENNQFKFLLKETHKKFNDRSYSTLGEIRHIAGMYIYFKKYNLLSGFNSSNLVNEFKKYIDDVFENKKINIDENRNEHWEPDDMPGYANLVFYEKSSEEFIQINKYLNHKIKSFQKSELKVKANEILKLFNSKPQELYSLLTFSAYHSGEYHKTPILNLIDNNQLSKIFVSCSNENKYIVADVLYSRYKHESTADYLIDEYECINSLISDLKKEKSNSEGEITFVVIENVIEKLDKGRSVLKKCLSIEVQI